MLRLTKKGHPSRRKEDGSLPDWLKVWARVMGEELATGSFKAKPDPFVLKGGLEAIQDALDLYEKGVSASKIVVEL